MRFHRLRPSQPDLFSSWRLLLSWRGVAARPRGPDLFDGGPPARLQTVLGVLALGRPHFALRVLIAIALTWLPLLALTALQSAMSGDASVGAFLTDYAAHARFLVALPLLLLGEKICLPQLGAIVRHFRDTGLIAPQDRDSFNRALVSTVRLRDSLRLEIAVLTISVAIALTIFVELPAHIFPAWHHLAAGGQGGISPAGLWHALVSTPILFILSLGWLWRLVLWTRFLWLVSRLNLCVMPAHPDGAGGLKFLGFSTQSFSVLACAFGAIVAGTVANRVTHDGASLFSFRYLIAGFDVLCLVLFVSPLLVFSGKLMEAWWRGSREYGALARYIGRALERKWLNREVGSEALEANDFSAAVDFYSVAANACTINIVPVAMRNIFILAAGAMLPFVPILLVAVPPTVLVQKLAGLLF